MWDGTPYDELANFKFAALFFGLILFLGGLIGIWQELPSGFLTVKTVAVTIAGFAGLAWGLPYFLRR
jgi:hypothetical protein